VKDARGTDAALLSEESANVRELTREGQCPSAEQATAKGFGGLRSTRGETQNGSMRRAVRLAALLVTVLCLCPSGVAQNQDRDSSGVPATSASAPPPEQRVDINHASIAELLKVPGMTASWAGRIVRFRPYRTKQDLLEMGVVNSKVYDRIKDFVIAHHDRQ
jgi:DNA uptake protein ComE-like DNA-binding protein